MAFIGSSYAGQTAGAASHCDSVIESIIEIPWQWITSQGAIVHDSEISSGITRGAFGGVDALEAVIETKFAAPPKVVSPVPIRTGIIASACCY